MKRRTTGNRRLGRHFSRQHLVELNVRTASVRRQRQGKVASLLWKFGALIVILCVLGLGVRYLALRFFFENPEYNLTHLETNLHGLMSDEELGDLTGIKRGKNVILIDLAEANKRLSAIPEVRAVSIERHFPDTVEVGIERRLPVFLLAPAGGATGDGMQSQGFEAGKSFICDKEGVVMQPSKLSDEFLHLPVLSGIDTSALKPGDRIDDERLAGALAVRDALSELPEETFSIVGIDVTKSYAVVVTDGSNARYTFGEKDLPAQIERLRKLLAHCQENGRRIATANLMIQRNTPVTFVLTPENRSAKIAPVHQSQKKPSKN